MYRALSIAATGMDAQELRISLIANNLANVTTNGFKRSRADFQDLLYQTLKQPGTQSAQGVQIPTGFQIGQGTRPVAAQRMHEVGEFKQTGNQLDAAIEGDGFFQIRLPSGDLGYTRDGAFKKNSEGNIVTSDGYPLDPPINIPAEAATVQIGEDGTVTAKVGNDPEPQQLGQLQLAKFMNPAGLEAMGRNLLKQTSASGAPVTGSPGDNTLGIGGIAQGFLEGSNVKVVEEMVEMIAGQRAYEMNTKTITTVEQMLRQITSR